MTLSLSHPSGARSLAKILLAGAMGFGMLALQGCVTSSAMPTPKYPIYMQDKPSETSPPAAAVGGDQPVTPVADDKPAVTPLASNGGISTTTLEPPPAPADIPAPVQAPVAAVPPPPVTGPVRDTGAAFVYVLQSHDTLYGVSRRFGVPVKQLYAINDLPQDASLRVGQKILLPATAVDKGVEDHANGSGMTRLATAVASVTPGQAQPVKPAPAVVPPVAKPASTMTTMTTTTTTVTKPVVTAPATKPATTSAATPPAKPPVTTTTTTTTVTKTVPVAPPANGAFPNATQISQMGRGVFTWPVRGKILVPYGQLAANVRNDGINISADKGTEVVASADGVVVYEGDQVKELGNTIYVKHPGGWYTGYSHLGTMVVKNNEKVSKGEVIGTVGQTGVIDRPQLHFEIRYTPSTDIAKPVDPNLVLP